MDIRLEGDIDDVLLLIYLLVKKCSIILIVMMS